MLACTVRINPQQCGLLQGFGYVDFGSRDSLNEAVAMSGTKFKGKDLFIAVSNPTGRGRGGVRGRGRGDLNRGQTLILMAAVCIVFTTCQIIASLCE